MFKYGDVIRAKEGTISSMFSKGRTGTVVEVRNWHLGGGGLHDLVRWGEDTISFGFNPSDVERVNE